MTLDSCTVRPRGRERWTRFATAGIHAGPKARDAGRGRGGGHAHGGDRWHRFAALPADCRRALLACAGWILVAWVGAALVAAGVDAFTAPQAAPWIGPALALCGVALAVLGLRRAYSAIHRCRSHA